MADIPSLIYYHDASSAYNLFGLPSWQLIFAGREVSPPTGVVKDPQRVFDEFTISCTLSNADWYNLRADLKAATTYGATYPYIDYTYQAGSTISLKVVVLACAGNKINDNEHRVSLTFRERKA